MLPLVALLVLASVSEAKVDFQYSTLFDEYDLNGKTEISLDICKNGGCSVYVSVPQWNRETARNLFVYGKTTSYNQSLYPAATEYDQITWAKNGLHLSNTAYSIMNYNKDSVGPIIIYVVGSQAPHYGQKDVEIYDAANINMRPATSKQYTMIMSVEPYNLYVSALGINLKAFVRATGFDNNVERNVVDQCQIVYDHNEGNPFRLRVSSPVLSINFDGLYNYQICANIDQSNGALLDYPGIATSQGYVGCAKNGFQVWRSSFYSSSMFELRDSSNTDQDTELNYIVNTNQNDKVQFTTFYQGGSKPFEATGTTNNLVTQTEKAYRINVVLNNGYGSSYWLGYTPKTGAVSVPSGQGICGIIPDPTTSSGVTQTKPTTTTSGASDLLTLLTSAIVCLFAKQY